MSKKFISLPYIYPVCPLNINHTRLYLFADIYARFFRLNGYEVIFSVASHYSGNTAHKMYDLLKQGDAETISLHQDFYKTPKEVVNSFSSPIDILNYYSNQTLWELKKINISCNYQDYYDTNSDEFSYFVKAIMHSYEEKGLLVKNSNDSLALNYDELSWKEEAVILFNNLNIQKNFHKKTIFSAFNAIKNDWGALRKGGFGVIFKEDFILDPMFDSELFTIYDLYNHFSKIHNKKLSQEEFYKLLMFLGSDETYHSENIFEDIKNSLPCDLFITEEHLKNWLVKRFYAESIFLPKDLQTKNYFVLGMGFLLKKRMSASRGHAILTKDLVSKYGPDTTRLIIILSGGHPSKEYSYTYETEEFACSLLSRFTSYYQFLCYDLECGTEVITLTELLDIEKVICEHIANGYFRQAIIILLQIIPSNFFVSDQKIKAQIIFLYKKYMDIFLPGYLNDFKLLTAKHNYETI